MFSYSLSVFRGAYSLSFVTAGSKIPPPSSNPVVLLPKPMSLSTCSESWSFIGRTTGPCSFFSLRFLASRAFSVEVTSILPPSGIRPLAALKAEERFCSTVSSSETTPPSLSKTCTTLSPSSVFTLLYPSAACSTASLASAAITSSTICLLVETMVPRPGMKAA